ncbi:DDE 3 domain containing protein [Asbolus verrucosus]|uniref:DDE 3 domain containing protein n=1 Tax=Asbolus verrucosus TaxID=1661398 RepID=A0A482W7X1_ASBVE|nr:DDE 3 domain containing protein [Asbolus verrucosus]
MKHGFTKQDDKIIERGRMVQQKVCKIQAELHRRKDISSSMRNLDMDLLMGQAEFSLQNLKAKIITIVWITNILKTGFRNNALYYSRIKNKQPTSTWKKKDITEWLVKSIYFEPGSLKQELLHLARANKQDNQYVIHEMAEQAGHKVLRLPLYHCQFNPIEPIWSQTKRYYDKHVGKNGYREEAVLNMWEESLRQVTPENWSTYFSHFEKLLQQWWQ